MPSSSCSVSAGCVAPAAMPQLDRDRILRERCSSHAEIAARSGLVLEAGRELRQQRAELAGRRQRLDRGAELVDVLLRRASTGRRPVAFWNISGWVNFWNSLSENSNPAASARPTPRTVGRRRAPVERRVDFDGVEVLGVERAARRSRRGARSTARRHGIEDAVPGAFARTGSSSRTCRCGFDASSSQLRGTQSLSKPNMTFEPAIRIGRRIRFGFSIIRSIASFFDRGSGRCLKTGLRVLTKSRNRSASMCFSRNARVGGSLLMSSSSTSTLTLLQKTSGVPAGGSGGFPVDLFLLAKHAPSSGTRESRFVQRLRQIVCDIEVIELEPQMGAKGSLRLGPCNRLARRLWRYQST